MPSVSASLGAIVGSVEFDIVTTACVLNIASTTYSAVREEAPVTIGERREEK
jgi:hypothetical protein